MEHKLLNNEHFTLTKNGQSVNVDDFLAQIGDVFDISVYNNNAKYADLAAALNGGANIPQSLQKGGMSVKFVQSSDNNYVQYRLMADEFTTDVTQWQGVEDEPTVDSKNLVSSSGIKTNLLELCYRSKEKKASQSLFASGQYSKIVESSTDIKGVTCEVVAGQKYHIKKSNVTDSFIVCIMTMPPNEWENSMKQSYPLFKEVNGETTEIDIVSPSNGWMLIGYTRSGESCEITVNSEDFYVLDRCTCYISDFVGNGAGTKIITTHGTSDSRGFYFPCKAGKTYVVVKSKASNRFRVTFLTTAPADWYAGLVPEIPKIVNYDDSDKLEFEFNAPNDGYIIICTSNLKELINLFVFEVTNMIQPKILSDGYVLREMPINPEWDKWNDIRYYWGFDINAQREFNTIKGVLESDTMLSVRGGKGRWSGGADFYGGHVFEGWSENELFRLTMLIGKFKESLACIQVYSPKGLYQTDAKRFGWVKIGSDNKREGVDFGKSNTIFYTPLTLQSRASAPESVPDYDLHPVLSDNTIPDGTMYYDTTLKKVRVKVNGEWKNVMLES